ncbi:hypothetical protein KKF11_00695 [Patescibacteria group bacterium]|nr:hypothetical protein [Patescibacteria group bacterium]
MKKIKLVSLFIFFLTYMLLAKQSLAAVRCESQYGGGEVCVRTGELQIDKKVWNPEYEKWFDNLGVGDYRFAPGEIVRFKLIIKNVGDETFGIVDVRDYLPAYLKHHSGDIEFKIEHLTAGETEEREFETKVVSSADLPNDKSLICVVNSAEAWSGDEKDKDTAQACLEKKVLGVTTLPATGVKVGTLLFLTSLITGFAGFKFLNKAKEIN